MHKLTPWFPAMLALVVLASVAGSVDVKAVPQGPDAGVVQSICRAPASCMSAILDSIPVARHVPELLGRQEMALEAQIPRIASFMHGLPVGKGSPLERMILKADPIML
jgi:hypothetical protein